MSTQAFKRKLSESSNGDGIAIDSTASLGTIIHTATSSTTAGVYDEIWLWVYNSHTEDVTLTVEFGGTEDNQIFTLSVPHRCGLVPILPGLILQNSSVVSMYASVADVINVVGFVHTLQDS